MPSPIICRRMATAVSWPNILPNLDTYVGHSHDGLYQSHSEGGRLVSTSPTRFSNFDGVGHYLRADSNPIEPISCSFFFLFRPFFPPFFPLFFCFSFPPPPLLLLISNREVTFARIMWHPEMENPCAPSFPSLGNPCAPVFPGFWVWCFLKIGGPVLRKGSDGRQCGR